MVVITDKRVTERLRLSPTYQGKAYRGLGRLEEV